jgi:glycosyltransferase involved in cell wall biosynthesis
MTLPISVFIIAHNEADRIATTIGSVRPIADEIIVIDSGSSDGTPEVAKALGARVFHHDWPGYGLQKRFGEEQCKHKWLLNLDADETLTPELGEEIRALFAQGEPPMAGYVLRVRDLLPGETKLAPMAHTNFVVRLYNKEKARFSDSPVHDTVQMDGQATKTLTHPVLHRSFRSLAHAIEKMNSYTSAQAENLLKKGMPFATLRLLTEFPMAFFKDYILRGYILRGRKGFTNAILYGCTRVMRIAKYLELREQREVK